MTTARIVVPIADGSEEMEAVIIVDILRRAGFEVILAAVGGSTTIRASRNIKIVADTLWREIMPDGFDAIVLPGGMGGTENLMRSESLLQALRDFYTAGKLVAAICAGPLVLQEAGIVKGCSVTCHPGVAEDLTMSECSSVRVVESGNMITSQGPGTAMEFSLQIIEYLGDKDTSEKVKAGLIV